MAYFFSDGSVCERVGSGGAAVYDAARIERYEAELTADAAAWENWFTQNSIVPVRLSYEALSADPSGTLVRVLDQLGVTFSAFKAVPVTRKMSDAQSISWVLRYRAERGD